MKSAYFFLLLSLLSITTFVGCKESAEEKKQKAIGFDFVLVNNSIEIFKRLQAKKMEPLPIFREIGRSLGTDLHLDKLTVKLVEEKVSDPIDPYAYNSGAGQEFKYLLDATMTISFPNSVSPDVGVEKVNSLQRRLQENLPGYEVNVIKQVADLSYTGNFQGESGGGDDPSAQSKGYDAEIQIRGNAR